MGRTIKEGTFQNIAEAVGFVATEVTKKENITKEITKAKKVTISKKVTNIIDKIKKGGKKDKR